MRVHRLDNRHAPYEEKDDLTCVANSLAHLFERLAHLQPRGVRHQGPARNAHREGHRCLFHADNFLKDNGRIARNKREQERELGELVTSQCPNIVFYVRSL